MRGRFNDDSFTEAAKAYRNIKAPSGLREKVLEGIERPVHPVKAGESGVRTSSGLSRKIYRFGALAACLAIMLVSMPGLLKEADMGGLLHGKELAAGVTPVSEDQVGTGQEPDISGEKTSADTMDILDRSVEPVPENQPAAAAESAGNQQPVYEPKPAAYSPNPAGTDFEVKTEPESGTEKDFPDSHSSCSTSLALSKLLPTMLGDESMVEGWEVRLVEAEAGVCTVEIASGEETAAVMTLSKNEENGHWEVSSETVE